MLVTPVGSVTGVKKVCTLYRVKPVGTAIMRTQSRARYALRDISVSPTLPAARSARMVRTRTTTTAHFAYLASQVDFDATRRRATRVHPANIQLNRLRRRASTVRSGSMRHQMHQQCVSSAFREHSALRLGAIGPATHVRSVHSQPNQLGRRARLVLQVSTRS